MNDPEAVHRARRDPDALGSLLAPLGAGAVLNLYVAALAPNGDVVARCLFRDGGEDPATGSAAGALCAYAARYLEMAFLRIRQGEAMGRPSSLRAQMRGALPVVSGTVHLIARGKVELAGR